MPRNGQHFLSPAAIRFDLPFCRCAMRLHAIPWLFYALQFPSNDPLRLSDAMRCNSIPLPFTGAPCYSEATPCRAKPCNRSSIQRFAMLSRCASTPFKAFPLQIKALPCATMAGLCNANASLLPAAPLRCPSAQLHAVPCLCVADPRCAIPSQGFSAHSFSFAFRCVTKLCLCVATPRSALPRRSFSLLSKRCRCEAFPCNATP